MLPTASISRLPGGAHKLTIQGRFNSPHWLVVLFLGLAEQKISVQSGRARCGEANHWEGEIVLDFSHSTSKPEALNYVEMALRQIPVPPDKLPRLTRFAVTRRADQALEAEVEGPDQTGFLARLLGRASLLLLFPTEIDIATVEGRVLDRFVFRGFAGAAPSEANSQSLESLLAGLVTAP